MLSELSGIFYTCGSISLGSEVCLNASTENAAVARRIFSSSKQVFGVQSELSIKEQQLKKNHTYISKIHGRKAVLDILDVLGIVFSGNINIDMDKFKVLTSRTCCAAAFLRGAFLGSGSVSNPQKNYHLEFVINSESLAEPLLYTFNKFDLNARVSSRKNAYIVYLKDADSIVKFLTLIGAHSSVLEFENIRIYKSTRGDVNRQINFENANMLKTVSASDFQIANIEYISATVGLNSLPKALRETAELRLENPDMSLQELADISGSITKSCINHRIRKINKIAQDLKAAKEE